MEQPIVRSIVDPGHLMDWFEARGYANVVLSLADVRELGVDWQLIAYETTASLGLYDRPDPEVASFQLTLTDGDAAERSRALLWLLLHAGRAGYLVWPVAQLRQLDMADLQRIQDLVIEYRDHRAKNWKPTRTEPCTCQGRGCPACDQRGTVEVLVEMSEQEEELAALRA